MAKEHGPGRAEPGAGGSTWPVGSRANAPQARSRLSGLASPKNRPTGMGDPDSNTANPSLHKDQGRGRIGRKARGVVSAPCPPHTPAHLGVSSQLQSELQLLTGAQCATSRGDFCSAEACLVPQELADTRVGLLSHAGRPGWTRGPGRVPRTAACSVGGWQAGAHSRTSRARCLLVGINHRPLFFSFPMPDGPHIFQCSLVTGYISCPGRPR